MHVSGKARPGRLCDLDDNCLRSIMAHLCPLPDRFNMAATCKVRSDAAKPDIRTLCTILVQAQVQTEFAEQVQALFTVHSYMHKSTTWLR